MKDDFLFCLGLQACSPYVGVESLVHSWVAQQTPYSFCCMLPHAMFYVFSASLLSWLLEILLTSMVSDFFRSSLKSLCSISHYPSLLLLFVVVVVHLTSPLEGIYYALCTLETAGADFRGTFNSCLVTLVARSQF